MNVCNKGQIILWKCTYRNSTFKCNSTGKLLTDRYKNAFYTVGSTISRNFSDTTRHGRVD